MDDLIYFEILSRDFNLHLVQTEPLSLISNETHVDQVTACWLIANRN